MMKYTLFKKLSVCIGISCLLGTTTLAQTLVTGITATASGSGTYGDPSNLVDDDWTTYGSIYNSYVDAESYLMLTWQQPCVVWKIEIQLANAMGDYVEMQLLNNGNLVNTTERKIDHV